MLHKYLESNSTKQRNRYYYLCGAGEENGALEIAWQPEVTASVNVRLWIQSRV